MKRMAHPAEPASSMKRVVLDALTFVATGAVIVALLYLLATA